MRRCHMALGCGFGDKFVGFEDAVHEVLEQVVGVVKNTLKKFII